MSEKFQIISIVSEVMRGNTVFLGTWVPIQICLDYLKTGGAIQ